MKLKHILLYIVCFKVTTSIAQFDLDSALIGYYPFTGNSNDVSVNNNDAISLNLPTLSEDCEGTENSAYYFDGIDNYLEIASTPQNNFENSIDFAISIWVRPEIVQANTQGEVNDILSKWSGLTSDGYPYAIRLHNQTNPNPGVVWVGRYESINYGCSEFPAITSSTVVADGIWHHIVFQKTDSLLQLYVDTNLEATVVDNTVCTVQNNSSIVLGNRTLNPNILDTRYYQGSIDELRIYNRSLTQIEINALAICGNICEEEIVGGVLSSDPMCDLSGINLIITAPDGTSITVATDANGNFTIPDGPYPCGIYSAAFEDIASLPTCYTDAGPTDPITFEVDGDLATNDGPFFIANPLVPTLSQWGLMILALLLMTFGTIKLGFHNTEVRVING